MNVCMNFIYEPYLCNGWHNLMHKAMIFNDIAIVSIKGNDYTIYFWYMRKDDAIDIMRNSNLNEKSGLIKDDAIDIMRNSNLNEKSGIL